MNNYFLGILIIELLKLYNKKEDYCIWETLNLLKNNYKNSNWEGKISQQNISKLIELLESEKTIKIITKIKKVRDSHLAHLDSGVYDNQVYVDEIDYLINLSCAVLDTVLKPLFNTDVRKGFNDNLNQEYLFEVSLEEFANKVKL